MNNREIVGDNFVEEHMDSNVLLCMLPFLWNLNTILALHQLCEISRAKQQWIFIAAQDLKLSFNSSYQFSTLLIITRTGSFHFKDLFLQTLYLNSSKVTVKERGSVGKISQWKMQFYGKCTIWILLDIDADFEKYSTSIH